MSKIVGMAARAAVTALASAGTWFAWLGWDHQYQWDSQTQTWQGPYETWQVVGCAVSFIVVAALAARWLPIWLVVPVMPIAFTLAWAGPAAREDDTGLWIVGALMVATGTSVGALVVALVSNGVARWRGGPPRRQVPALPAC